MAKIRENQAKLCREAQEWHDKFSKKWFPGEEHLAVNGSEKTERVPLAIDSIAVEKKFSS